jgi:hypothetical protein
VVKPNKAKAQSLSALGFLGGDGGESNSFPSVHGRPCSYVDATFSTLREASLFDNVRGCPPAQMSEMVSTRFDRVMRTPGLEDRAGPSATVYLNPPMANISGVVDRMCSLMSTVVRPGGCQFGCQALGISTRGGQRSSSLLLPPFRHQPQFA